MSKEFFSQNPDMSVIPPLGFSMDTVKPRLTVVHPGENLLRQEHYGSNDLADVLSGSTSLSFGKFEVDKYFDVDGDIVDWRIYLGPMIDENSVEFIKQSIASQPSQEDSEKLEKLFVEATPIVEIAPREGVVMLLPGNSIHLERERKYVRWSDGSERELPNRDRKDEIHYVDRNGMTVKVVRVPGKNGELVDLDFECDIKYLSTGIDDIIKRMHQLIENDDLDQQKIRGLINATVSIFQVPSDGGSAILVGHK